MQQADDEIVAFGLTKGQAEILITEGYTVLRQVEPTGASLLGLPDDLDVEAALDRVALLAPEVTVAPNSYYRNQAGPEDCAADICATWTQVDWGDAADRACLFQPRIGVVDTGVNLAHDMLLGADITVIDHADPEAAPSGERHGTAVVAMLVGRLDGRVPGLVPDATLVVADPFTSAGGDVRADAFSLYVALQALIAQEVVAINLSLAGPPNALVEQVIAEAVAAGIAVVAAVGNEGPQAEPLFPAAYPGVIGVTAVDGRGRVYRRAGQGAHVDMAAPGVEVATAASISGVRPQTGTSFAVPFVTVAMAVAAAMNPDLSLDERVALVTGAGIDLGETGRDPVFGAGLVQIGAPC